MMFKDVFGTNCTDSLAANKWKGMCEETFPRGRKKRVWRWRYVDMSRLTLNLKTRNRNLLCQANDIPVGDTWNQLKRSFSNLWVEAYEEIVLPRLKKFKATRGFQPMTCILYITHLFIGPLGSGWYCFPENLGDSKKKPNQLFPKEQVKCFLI